MEYIFLGIVIFLFLLATIDLSVGVSNDAVNFLNSAIGSKTAKFKTVIIVASIGIFLGAVMSNGMMEIARHGVFRPEQLSLFDVMCIFTAVMVTEIILLDVFNTLGLPTSTTVSMVFGLLGAAFAVSLFKVSADNTGLGIEDILNSEKALTMIVGIFLSVGIAFFFGTVVQYLSRLWFSFNYRNGLTWKIGIFGGISITAIVYFLLVKGAKELQFMTPEVKEWIASNTTMIICSCLIFFTLLCQLLHYLKINVFKVIVLTGTFALAMAFAGNDLVNFIGVPLAGLSSYQDWSANGGGDPQTFMMNSLNGPSNTSVIFLVVAGVIMVISLAISKKARKVVETSVNLSRQDGGDEMFGSSRIARRLVRMTIDFSEWVVSHTPQKVRAWTARKLDTNEVILEHNAAFDLVRASINLVLAGALIALGTSLKLPLSTTYVTFMVAMGTSLADRAWGRESAVFRITGVISVIGGWFITAGAAFVGAALVVSVMHVGGTPAIIICAIVAIIIIVRNNIHRHSEEEKEESTLFQTIIATKDPQKSWELLKVYIVNNEVEFLQFAGEMQRSTAEGFFSDKASMLSKTVNSLARYKSVLKNNRRKATLCLKQVPLEVSVEYSTWFHLINNAQMSMLYNMRRIAEVCHEHVDNNFNPLPQCAIDKGRPICDDVNNLMNDTCEALASPASADMKALRRRCEEIRDAISTETRRIYGHMRQQSNDHMSVIYVYLNMLQEQQELVASLRKLIRANIKLSMGADTQTRMLNKFEKYA